MTKILFITWDGPQTNYLEGLFAPIFEGVQKEIDVRFYVLQFTWASKTKTDEIKQELLKKDIHYQSYQILRKPNVTLGTLWTLIKGILFLKRYIRRNKIDVLMPRSILPAIIINRINTPLPIVYDADGLIIEERVDFAGLKKGSFMYNFFHAEEKKIVLNSNKVITRSQKAIDYLSKKYSILNGNKFKVVINGRDANLFNIVESKEEVYKELSIPFNSSLMIYVGSLGEKYALKEMLEIFQNIDNEKFYFLLLTNDVDIAQLNTIQCSNIHIKKVPISQVNKYINAADIAIGLIYPTKSMIGASAIKYGEYLLTGTPTIASKGIGDSEKILQAIPGTFIFDHMDSRSVDKAVEFIKSIKDYNPQLIRNSAISYFSLNAAIQSYQNILSDT